MTNKKGVFVFNDQGKPKCIRCGSFDTFLRGDEVFSYVDCLSPDCNEQKDRERSVVVNEEDCENYWGE